MPLTNNLSIRAEVLSLGSHELREEIENQRGLNWLGRELYVRRNKATMQLTNQDVATDEGRFAAVKLQAEIATITSIFEMLDGVAQQEEA